MKPVLRYPGSKWNIADWIISHMPPHVHYLEPYFGSGAVLFRKPRARVETVNDMDGRVYNLFRVLRDRPAELAALIHMTPWSRLEYMDSYDSTGDDLEDARRFLVRCWQAFGVRSNWRSGWKNEISGDQGKMVTAVWKDLPDRILEVAERLRGVQIECSPTLTLIRRMNDPGVLIYADPPYLGIRKNLYAFSMDEEDHFNLLETLMAHPGPVLLSCYDNELYTHTLEDFEQTWKCFKSNATADGGRPREEVLWMNPIAAEMREGVLF